MPQERYSPDYTETGANKMEGPESMPYDEIEQLCNLLGVEMNIYSIKQTIVECAKKVIALHKELDEIYDDRFNH